MSSTTRNHIAVISGGSAANSLVCTVPKSEYCDTLVENRDDAKLSYIIGISDNGGSTSEIIRVFGGPGIGDIRSRLVRLVPSRKHDKSKEAIKRLLNYRLPKSYEMAKEEWSSIVEGRHELWHNIPSERKELIRSFFIFVKLTKRARPTSAFNFQLASLGNLFLTGTRLFFGSLESAIYLAKSILEIPEHINVIPALNSNFSHHIAAGLVDKIIIVGQNQISHPTNEGPVPEHGTKNVLQPPTPSPGPTRTATPIPSLALGPVFEEDQDLDEVEDANLPGSLPSLRKGQIEFSKEQETDLSSRIDRLWYINPYGQEMRIKANPRVLSTIKEAELLVYSIGSLYTSIIPCLVLKGVGEAIYTSCRHKVLILNGSYDREIGPGTDYTALDFIKAITRACVDSRNPTTTDEEASLSDPKEYKHYVSHVVYLEGSDVPSVDTAGLKQLGIESWRVYGRRNEKGRGMLYDANALAQSLEMILGKRSLQSRRQTLDATNAINPFLKPRTTA